MVWTILLPPVKPPNIDRIANEGIYFEKAYVAFPVCAPTRQSQITGQYPQVHVQFGNANDDGGGLGMLPWEDTIQAEGKAISTSYTDFYGAWCPSHPDWYYDGTNGFKRLEDRREFMS